MTATLTEPAVEPSPPRCAVRARGATSGATARRSRLRDGLVALIIPAVVVVLWWVATANHWVSPVTLAAPERVGAEFVERLGDGTLMRDVGVSVARALVGLVLSVLIGVVLGLIAGLSTWGHRLLDGSLHALHSIPFPALIPLMVIWLTIGEPARIATIVLAASFSIYLNTVGGILGVDPKLRELAHTRGVTGWHLVRTIVLPGALPQFFVGLRLALVVSFLALVFGEEIAPEAGLGFIVWRAQQYSDTASMILAAFIYALIGLLISALVTFLERAALPWRKGFRE